MKALLTSFCITLLFVLCSCRTSVSVSAPTERKPDTLKTPTESVVSKDVQAELPKGSVVKPEPDVPIEVKTSEPAVVEVLPQKDPPEFVILPKGTDVVLPQNTPLETEQDSKVLVPQGTQIKLPQGTEVELNRVNWYAILFFMLLACVVVYWWIRTNSPDKYDTNKDGFIDTKEAKKIKGKRKVGK